MSPLPVLVLAPEAQAVAQVHDLVPVVRARGGGARGDAPLPLVAGQAHAPGLFDRASHAPPDGIVEKALTQAMRQKVQYRTHAEVSRFFDGLDLIEPGVVHLLEWRPDEPWTRTAR